MLNVMFFMKKSTHEKRRDQFWIDMNYKIARETNEQEFDGWIADAPLHSRSEAVHHFQIHSFAAANDHHASLKWQYHVWRPSPVPRVNAELHFRCCC